MRSYIEWQFWVYEYINITKTHFKIRQSKIALKETPTLKLGLTLVMTVTQVCVFVNLHATLIPMFYLSSVAASKMTTYMYITAPTLKNLVVEEDGSNIYLKALDPGNGT